MIIHFAAKTTTLEWQKIHLVIGQSTNMASHCLRISCLTRISSHGTAHVRKNVYQIIQIICSGDGTKLKRAISQIIWYFTPTTKILSLAETEMIISLYCFSFTTQVTFMTSH